MVKIPSSITVDLLKKFALVAGLLVSDAMRLSPLYDFYFLKTEVRSLD